MLPMVTPTGNLAVDPLDVNEDGYLWLTQSMSPRIDHDINLTGDLAAFLLTTAKKLQTAGWQILDKQGEWYDTNDANGWLGSMKQFYAIPESFAGYHGFDDWWMFDSVNQDSLIDTGGINSIAYRPNYIDPGGGRLHSGFFGPTMRDFPSPFDFNAVLTSAIWRIKFRTKLCLTAARLGTFGRHGGRKPRLEQ